jgi:hypothetical protein
VFEVRAEHEQTDDECSARDQREDDDERDDPLPDEFPALPPVVRDRDARHERRSCGRRRPDGKRQTDDCHHDAAARGGGRALEAVSQQIRGLVRHDTAGPIDERFDGARIGEQRERAEHDEQAGRDGEEQ